MCVHHPNTPRRLARNSRQRRPGGWTAGKLGRPRQAPAQSRTSRLAEGPAARWGLATLGAAFSRRPETLAQWQAQPQQTARFDANACRLGPARNQGRRSGRRGTRPRPTRTRETPREIVESGTQRPKAARFAGAGRRPACSRARLSCRVITMTSDLLDPAAGMRIAPATAGRHDPGTSELHHLGRGGSPRAAMYLRFSAGSHLAPVAARRPIGPGRPKGPARPASG